MNEIAIKITIKQTGSSRLRVSTEIPEDGSAMLICGQLSDISRHILDKVQDKISMNCFATEDQARAYETSLTIGDLA